MFDLDGFCQGYYRDGYATHDVRVQVFYFQLFHLIFYFFSSFQRHLSDCHLTVTATTTTSATVMTTKIEMREGLRESESSRVWAPGKFFFPPFKFSCSILFTNGAFQRTLLPKPKRRFIPLAVQHNLSQHISRDHHRVDNDNNNDSNATGSTSTAQQQQQGQGSRRVSNFRYFFFLALFYMLSRTVQEREPR